MLAAYWIGSWVAACGNPGPAPDAAEPASVVVKPADRDPRWADARCNDGTPFAYTVSPGAPDLWVVNLQGGYFCDDHVAPCRARKRRLTTTVPEPDGAARPIKQAGLFGRDPATNPTFARASMVDAHYCSSDLWLGDGTERRPTSGEPDRGWYFNGRANVRALFESLARLHGLDDQDPDTRLLLLGTSAGGAGVVGNLDAIAKMLPTVAGTGRLRVVLDGSWVPEQPAGAALPRADAWGPVHPACDRDLQARGDDPARCIYGDVWWPYVRATGIPVLVQLSGLDRSQTPVFGIRGAAAEATWQARTRASLEQVPWVFSGGHAYHVVAIGPGFHRGAPGRSFADVLGRFWSDAPPEQVFFRYAAENSRNGGTPGR